MQTRRQVSSLYSRLNNLIREIYVNKVIVVKGILLKKTVIYGRGNFI